MTHINKSHSLDTISMAPSLMTNSISSLQQHSRIPLVNPKFVNKATHVTKSLIRQQQPFASRIKNPLPGFKIDEYMMMKAKKINKAVDEAFPLILQNPTTLLDNENEGVYGTLCIASCELVGGNESSVMPLACATEMFMKMILSRTLLCHAIQYMATKTDGVSSDRLVKAIGEISSAVSTRGILAGTIMDIKNKGKEFCLRELEIIRRLKTGKFIEASVVSGVLIGGGNEEETERLRKYGKCVGLAYQVWEDKETYPNLMGVDGAKKYARELVAEANEQLAYFDSTRAAPLYHMANFMASDK